MYQPKCTEFWVEWKAPLDFHLTYLIRVEPLPDPLCKKGWVGMPLSRGKTDYEHNPRPENNSTSFKARLSLKSPGANGLKQFTWFAHSDYFSGHHYEFFRKRGGGRKVTVFFNTFRKFSITLILLMIYVLSSHNY